MKCLHPPPWPNDMTFWKAPFPQTLLWWLVLLILLHIKIKAMSSSEQDACSISNLRLPRYLTHFGAIHPSVGKMVKLHKEKMPGFCPSIFSQFLFSWDAQIVCSWDVKSSDLPFCIFPAHRSLHSLRNSLRCQQTMFDVCSSFPYFGPVFSTCSFHTLVHSILKGNSIYVPLHFTLFGYNYWLVLILTILFSQTFSLNYDLFILKRQHCLLSWLRAIRGFTPAKSQNKIYLFIHSTLIWFLCLSLY